MVRNMEIWKEISMIMQVIFIVYTFYIVIEKKMNLKVKGNRKIITGLMVLHFLTVSFGIYGQGDSLRFKRISIKDGLSNSSINCILQDKEGFMWFGTKDGLNRYDGYNFVIYNDPIKPGGISDNDILSICEDKSGILWIGTYGGEVNRFDRKTGKFYHYSVSNKKLDHNEVRAILEDSKGIIWVGTYGGGLYKYEREKDEQGKDPFINYQHNENGFDPSSNMITTIYEDKSGILWIGTEGGLYQFDRLKKAFIPYSINKGDATGYCTNRIAAICEDQERFLWIGTKGGGLVKFKPMDNLDNHSFQHFKHEKAPNSLSSDEITVIFADSADDIWIGTYGGGLNRFNRKVRKFTNYKNIPRDHLSISKNYITSIYEDRSGNLWIGTRAPGLNIIKHIIPFSLYRWIESDSNSTQNDIRALFEDSSGTLWIGTFGDGLKQFDRRTGKFTRHKANPGKPGTLSHNIVRAIYEDRVGRLWIGTEGGGLNKYDRETGKFTNIGSLNDNEVWVILEDNSENFWIGTSGGLVRFNPGDGKITTHRFDPDNPNTLSNNTVLSICEGESGVLWIGTRGGGLNKFDIGKNCFTRYQHNKENTSNSLSHNEVRCICRDRNGVLWVGTSYGLNKLDQKKGEFKSYLEEDGLPNNVIYSILQDNQGNLWMGTNRGLVKFDPVKSTFKNYDSNDGLQSDEFNYGAFFKNKNGELFFGGIDGFNIFDPIKIKEDSSDPPVVITNFLLANQPVAPQWRNPGSPLKNTIDETDLLTLTNKQSNVFSFEFAALQYSNPRKIRYKYKMEDWDKDWIETDGNNRRATYTNLPSGNYIFKVITSNNDGIWDRKDNSIKGTSIKVKILPPPGKPGGHILYTSLLALSFYS